MGNHLLKCYKCHLVVKNQLNESCNETPATALKSTTSAEILERLNQLDDTAALLEFTEEKMRRLVKMFTKSICYWFPSIYRRAAIMEFFEELQPLFRLPTRKGVSTTH